MKRTLLSILLVSLLVGPVGCKNFFEPEPTPKQGNWCITIMPGDCS